MLLFCWKRELVAVIHIIRIIFKPCIQQFFRSLNSNSTWKLHFNRRLGTIWLHQKYAKTSKCNRYWWNSVADNFWHIENKFKLDIQKFNIIEARLPDQTFWYWKWLDKNEKQTLERINNISLWISQIKIYKNCLLILSTQILHFRN